jgi:hypothetical protein
VNHPQIAIFARLAKENTAPVRRLEGQKTLLSRTMHDFAFDPIHDEIVVTSPFAQAILTFRGGASGEEPPLRVIQGPRTRIVEARALDRLTIDPVHNEIYVTTSASNILVFPREANGDVAPIRVIGGPDVLIGSRPGLRVDPVRNLLVVGTGYGGDVQGGVLVFDRLATGNARPRAVIPGLTTGDQFALYPPTGLIIINREGAIEGWNIDEALRLFEHVTGTEKPEYRPRFRVTAQIPASDNRGGGGTGIALNPVHKEILTASQTRNTVWTFSVPEAFQDPAPRTAAR